MIIHFDNSYARLPAEFYTRLLPTPVREPKLIRLNTELAETLRLELAGVDDSELAAIFSGNRIPEGAEPLAMVYAGHQFGNFVPRLGDGRAILLGEVIDREGMRRDLHLKGAGPTPYSRGGDGRAALGPVIREFIVSEAMHALGVPTTRTLAAVTTGELVAREQPLPGAILTRVARSHLRVGTFEYFAARGDRGALKRLADYAIERHYPELSASPRAYFDFLEAVMEAQARLVADWMMVGFIHGVMNTDNMTISGETIDYGPCAFMDAYDPMKVYSSIDRHGRYAFGNQPAVAQWNLARLAECLLPLMDPDTPAAVRQAEELLANFAPRFEKKWLEGMRRKLGLSTAGPGDLALIQDFLALIEKSRADFTNSFAHLFSLVEGGDSNLLPGGQTLGEAEFKTWLARWRERLDLEPGGRRPCALTLRKANPFFIPRNHRIAEVIDAATAHSDFSKMDHLMRVLSRPDEPQDDEVSYRLPPKPGEEVQQTFCGT